MRYSDIGSVEGIAADMRAWLDASPGVDRSLPLFVGLASLDNHACNLTVLVHLAALTLGSTVKKYEALM